MTTRQPRPRRPSVLSQTRTQTTTGASTNNQNNGPEAAFDLEETRRMLEYRNTPPLFVTHTRDFFIDVARYPIGFKVATMQAIDSDGDQVEYSLQPANKRDASPYFSVNPTTGELRLAHQKFPAAIDQLTDQVSGDQEDIGSFPAKRPGAHLYYLNVVANDGKYNSVVELQIHVFNSSSSNSSSSSSSRIDERKLKLQDTTTSASQALETAPVEFNPPRQETSKISEIVLPESSLTTRQAQDLTRQPAFVTLAHEQTQTNNHQQQQMVLSVAVTICSLLVIALVLLLFIVPLSVKRLRKRLKSMESSMKQQQQQQHDHHHSRKHLNLNRQHSQQQMAPSSILSVDPSSSTTTRLNLSIPSSTSQELYYPIDNYEFYSTIQTQSSNLEQISPDPGAPVSLVGHTYDSRAYLGIQCAQQVQRIQPRQAFEMRPSTPESISSRSSTRSLARFLSLPARHSAHQDQHHQQTLLESNFLADEFDLLKRNNSTQQRQQQQQQHFTKTIARANNIEREVQKRRGNTTKTSEQENNKWEIERFRLRTIDIIGEGQFGQVWRCKLKLSPHDNGSRECPNKSSLSLATTCSGVHEQTVAVKTLKRSAAENQTETGELLSEIEVMKLVCGHPNVIKLMHCCTQDLGPGRPVLLVMEYAELGKLQSFLEKCRLEHNYATTTNAGQVPLYESTSVNMSNEYCYDEFQVAKQKIEDLYHLTSRDLIRFIYHIAKGMEYISSQNIMHRDIASRNILVSSSRICKIGDFGMARHLQSDLDVYKRHSRHTKIPVRWMAPEVLLENCFTTKSDVFSFGILMWEIVTLGSTPYRHLKAEQILQEVARGGQRPSRPDYCHELVYNLMASCWQVNSAARPTFSELVAELDNLLLSKCEYIELDQYPSHEYYNIPAQLVAPDELV